MKPHPPTSNEVSGHPGAVQDDPLVGAPLCADCYDWHSAVVWQWWVPRLWTYTTTALKRAVAGELAVPKYRLPELASVQFAKVAENQARGLVHVHAMIRLDGSDGPGSPSPLSGERLAELVEQVARSVTLTRQGVDAEDPARTMAWGQQLDVRVVGNWTRTDDPMKPLKPEQVAGYLAKYATKDANSLRSGGRYRPHLDRMAETCRELAARADRFDLDRLGWVEYHAQANLRPYGLLGKWAHMLGFRGHFSTKSRKYSITLGALRRARHRFQKEAADAARTGTPMDTRDLETRLLADDDETTLVVGEWRFQGTGWTNPGDEALALAAAARAREYAEWKAQQRRELVLV